VHGRTIAHSQRGRKHITVEVRKKGGEKGNKKKGQVWHTRNCPEHGCVGPEKGKRGGEEMKGEEKEAGEHSRAVWQLIGGEEIPKNTRVNGRGGEGEKEGSQCPHRILTSLGRRPCRENFSLSQLRKETGREGAVSRRGHFVSNGGGAEERR